MPTWVFALIVIGFGVALAFIVDHLRFRPRMGPGDPASRRERAKWLYYWYLGRFPTKEEEAADDEQAEEAELARQEELDKQELERRRKK